MSSLVLGLGAVLAGGAAATPATGQAVVAGTGHAAACRPGVPSVTSGAGRRAAQQLITVRAAAGATWGVLRLWQRRGACFSPVAGPWPARLGTAGLSTHHVEGDGTTPEGTFGIGPVMYGIGPDPGVAYRWRQLVCGDWWDEDPLSPRYNQFVALPCGQSPPFGGDSEALWTEAPDYDAFAVIEYNTDPTIPGRGSAIFLHEDTAAPTTGCVALATRELVETLRWLRPGDGPLISIGLTTGGR